MKLTGRHTERHVLEQLIDAVRSGESRALVLQGEAGVGKSALLDHLGAQASDCRIIRTAGVESDMELAFAGLQQLCAPILDLAADLPGSQRDALWTAFGISDGPPPDRFLVALAVLALLSNAADTRPLLCLVDDEQWLDTASAQVLAFVARRLVAESVAIVFAARVPSGHVSGLPELMVRGLAPDDAGTLLDTALPTPLDAKVRDQIVAETRGNPLALLELPRGLSPLELAGGFGILRPGRFAGDVEGSFRLRVEALPHQTRLLLVLAAAETTGDPVLVGHAAARLGISVEARAPATEANLVEFGDRVRFRHPLVRSAAYRSASIDQRRQVHHALAEVSDPRSDPDRRAWHRAQAAPGPDEDIALELERSADRAQARGGIAAAAAFLERATTLTLDRSLRVGRALAAASANVEAGALDTAPPLLAVAETGPLTELQHSRLDLIRAQLAFVTNRGRDAPPLLLQAAKRLEPVDVRLSRATYLEAFAATQFAGRFAVDIDAWDVARHAGAAPSPRTEAQPSDLLLDGVAANYNHGYAAGVPLLRAALTGFAGGAAETELRWLWLACVAAAHTWDDKHWHGLSVRLLESAREVGALSELPHALTSLAYTLLFAGELAAAAALIEEGQAVAEAVASSSAPYGPLGLAAFRGRSTEVAMLSEANRADMERRGEGDGITCLEWANAVVNNGTGHYPEAMAAAERGGAYAGDLGGAVWNCVELVEAAARSGMCDTAIGAYHRIQEMAAATGTDWACGVAARSHALVSDGDPAEVLYLAAIERLGRTRCRPDLARAHLLYGEWLRRERRRADARAQLRLAHSMFDAMGMEAFGERARRELQATGETARKRAHIANSRQLTAQEMQVARLARDGLSNPEIGNRLFISNRTVQYHLGNVFAKLDIASRSQLDDALPTPA